MTLLGNINFNKLKSGLTKTRNKIVKSIQEVISGKAILDEETIDKIEEILVTADIGFETTSRIIEKIRTTLKSSQERDESSIITTIKAELESILINNENKIIRDHSSDFKPYIILIVGVNGVGKTTTIGKLAYNLKQKGKKVILGAADTFRAAAGEQLDAWAARAGVDILQKKMGTDPSAVAFDTVQKALSENYDYAIIDTAGRLHNKNNLMQELGKINRAINKVLPNAPNDTYLILDGTVGQNAIFQAEEFVKVTDITGLIITKLDGSAKGGVVFQIIEKHNMPIRYIGVGESIDDLQIFEPESFVEAIFGINGIE